MSTFEMLGRLIIAAACSALIGYERETAQKAAGLRTHTLVGVGAAIFTVASITGFDGPDESRVAAQIVTGVGFLGAGAIFREGAFVRGLTTAAGLWVVAALGMAAGSGTYALATMGTGVTLGTLYGLRAVDALVARRKTKIRRRLEVYIGEVAKLEQLLKFIRRIDPDSEQLDFKRTGAGTGVLVVTCGPDDRVSGRQHPRIAGHGVAVEHDQVLESSPQFRDVTHDDHEAVRTVPDEGLDPLHGEVEMLGIEAAEPFVEEEGVEPSAGPRHHLRQRQGQRQRGEERLAAGEAVRLANCLGRREIDDLEGPILAEPIPARREPFEVL